MYARINEPALRAFFEKNALFVKKLISQGMKKVLAPARAPRIAVYRAVSFFLFVFLINILI